MCKVEIWEYMAYAAVVFSGTYSAIFACIFAYKFLFEAPHKMYAELDAKYKALLAKQAR